MRKFLNLLLSLSLLLSLLAPFPARAADPAFRVLYQENLSSPVKKLGEYEYLYDAAKKVSIDPRGGIYTVVVLKDKAYTKWQPVFGGTNTALNDSKYVYIKSEGSSRFTITRSVKLGDSLIDVASKMRVFLQNVILDSRYGGAEGSCMGIQAQQDATVMLKQGAEIRNCDTGVMMDSDCLLDISEGATVHDNWRGIKTGPGAIINLGGVVVNNRVCGVHIGESSTLVVREGSRISGNGNHGSTGGGIYAEANSIVTISGTVEENSAALQGGGIYLSPGCKLIMGSEGSIKNNQVINDYYGSGGGIYAKNSKITLFGEVQSNSSYFNGGGIYLDEQSELTLFSSALIRNNKASNAGGGIIAYSGSKVTMYGGTVSENKAYLGGGVCLEDYSTLDMLVSSALIKNNEVPGLGGGIYAYDSCTVEISGVVEFNKAELYGGICIAKQSTLVLHASGVVQDNTSIEEGGGIAVTMGSTATSKGTIQNNAAGRLGGGIIVSNSSELTITGGSIIKNKVSWSGDSTKNASGGGIYASKSELNIQDAAISGNELRSFVTSAAGGGIVLHMSRASISGCQINNNYVQGAGNDNAGGGIWVGINSSLILEESTLYGNRAIQYLGGDISRGGGLEVYIGGAAEISDCTFEMNYSDYGGGIMAVLANKLYINGTNILRNDAMKESGGGVMVYETDEFLMDHSKLANNATRSHSGGGLCVYLTRVARISYCTLLENKAELFGGGIFLRTADTDISNCTIQGNKSNSGGGGLYAVDSMTDLQDISFSYNTTGGDGGGAFLVRMDRNGAGSTLSRNRFLENSAGKGGGGLSVELVTVTMDSSDFEENTARVGGAVCHVSAPDSRMDIAACRFLGNKAEYGGAIYNHDHSYEDPADTDKYQDLFTDWETEFDGNEASLGLMEPPVNWDEFDNLKFKTLSAVTVRPSPLNNYDINYMRDSDTYSLTYMANNGTVTNWMDSYPINSTATLKGAEELGFSYPGYAFTGWNDQADGTGNAYDAGGMLFMDYNKTLYAQWEEGFILTYDANGGEGGPHQDTYLKNTDATVKTAAEVDIRRDNHRFTGWNTEKDSSGTAYQPGEIMYMDADITLYAQWEEIRRLTYHPNGGLPNMTVKRYYPINTDAAVEEILYIRDGFVLDGYNTEPDSTGDTYHPGDPIFMDQDKTLYAHWKKACALVYVQTERINPPPPFVVEHYAEGSMVTLKEPGELLLNIPDRIFAGWKAGKADDSPVYQPGETLTLTEDTRLYGQWKNKYTLTYDANNTTGQTADEDHAEDETFDIKEIASLGFTYPGYLFVCWNTEADGSGADIMPGESMFLRQNRTLYAKWGKGYTLTYDANGGMGILTQETYDKGATAIVKSDGDMGFSRIGHLFTGWNTAADGSGTAYAKNDAIIMNADHTLYAQWKKQATLSYDANEGDGGIKDETYDAPADVVIKTEKALGFARAGFVFTEWNTMPDGTGADYAPGASVTLNDDLALFAEWKEEFALTYKANGGAGADVVENYLDGQQAILKDASGTGFSRAGFVFAGWNTAADGSGTGYKQGNKLIITADTLLYAQWQPVAEPTDPPTPTYPTIRVPIHGNKQLINGSLKADQFSFVLKDAANKTLATVTNEADGSIIFPDRTFSKVVKNYIFKIHEVKGSLPGIAYDDTVYTLKVTTMDDGGKLKATVELEKNGVPCAGGIAFRNVRELPPTGDSTARLILLLLATTVLLTVVACLLHRKQKSRS